MDNRLRDRLRQSAVLWDCSDAELDRVLAAMTTRTVDAGVDGLNSYVVYTITFESEVANMLNLTDIYRVGDAEAAFAHSPHGARAAGVLSVFETDLGAPADGGTPSVYVNTTLLARVPTGADYMQAVVPVAAGASGSFAHKITPLIAGAQYYVRRR